jgi:hypothetical protein
VYSEPFKNLYDCAQRMLPTEEKARCEEYFCVLLYHLTFAQEAANKCSEVLYGSLAGHPGANPSFGVDQSGSQVYLFGFHSLDLVRHGDVAIREAASVIDAGLLLTNHVLGIGIDQGRLSWNHPQASRSLKAQLERLPDGKGVALATAIQRVWDSIGYELLQQYRNWVTHRGAPRVVSELNLPGPIPIPREILSEADPLQRDRLLRTHLLSLVPDKLHIQCAAFYPPVMLIFNADVSGAPEDMILPGRIYVAIRI